MSAKYFVVLALAAFASALPVVPVAKSPEPEAPVHYEFQYSVNDNESGDVKQHQESRTGDVVQGSYSLVQPDGVHRIVEYTADAVHGFNANVSYEGHPTQAPVAAKIAYAAPVAKVPHSAPIHHAAPVAKVANSAPIYHAAPVAMVAYAAPFAQVSHSSPAISYHY